MIRVWLARSLIGYTSCTPSLTSQEQPECELLTNYEQAYTMGKTALSRSYRGQVIFSSIGSATLA